MHLRRTAGGGAGGDTVMSLVLGRKLSGRNECSILDRTRGCDECSARASLVRARESDERWRADKDEEWDEGLQNACACACAR
eukprot:6190889-Pleurochrysis_carterae.AAC.3